MKNKESEVSFDFVVVGSGIAGLSYALKVAEFGRVAVITKKNLTESNTYYAQGGIACVTSVEDNFEMHIADTLVAGAGLCNEEVVCDVVEQGPDSIHELVEMGVKFSQRENFEEHVFDLGKEGGHSKRRVLHVGDATGKEIEEVLVEHVRDNPKIFIFEHHYAIDLITSTKMKIGSVKENRCLGVYALDSKTGQIIAFSAALVVLATGGCGKCYLYTTNPSIATADGVAMAYRAGVGIANMEFIQFHPTCLYHPKNQSFLISEALRGEGAILVNAAGEDFSRKYHPAGSLGSRDIVARAIDAEMKASGATCVYLDITSRSREFLKKRFPTIYQTCLDLGIDIAKEPIPVVPAAHYQCGGVVAKLNGETSLPGLLAIGEVACTGLHGANRLASNSLLEGVVMAGKAALFSKEILEDLKHHHSLKPWQDDTMHDPDELVVITHNWREIRQLMWDYVGIVRTTKRLLRAQARLKLLMQEVQEYYWNFKITADLIELRNLALASHLIVESALVRKESRGLHYTTDYPNLSSEKKNTVLKQMS